ncbi:uncharacterized protein F4807DRAFT_427814 [Annulohypoxylon truncatum]|uniref:uncharacterized protein n=1 Tax=Annulohypoxylon truncatum TaxID=327061 RepID=UPI0020073AFF|nr:uncharacterized protein F4807DRAFT_427814 [Annulohypoxylon truncatum]KAI1209272.1 hypothetical protein F4807DRAFT_427814 [Annulohypoxylon truncatum]
MESRSSRYQSRILREMHQNTENPFNSPPSSTGTHGTITLTSNITMGPQGESTRRMDDVSIDLPSQAAMRSAKAPQSTSFNVNTSALGRTFPEWSRWNPNGPEHKDTWDVASNDLANLDEKENVTPLGSPNSIAATPRADNNHQDNPIKATDAHKSRTTTANRDAVRTRAQMQPRVQTESECSLDLSESLAQPQEDTEDHGIHRRVSVPISGKGPKPRRGNVTALLETLKTAQTKQAESKEQSVKHSSPKPQQPSLQPRNAAKAHMERPSALSHTAGPATPNQTARSFFLPNFSYINDFLSGTLRLSSLRNGMPIFVKHGKVHDRESTSSPDHHVDVEAIAIPEDEEKIFVSLDKIKDEIHALKEHDEMVSRQAEQLQEEIEDLQIQIAKYKSRKDSAMGSDSESSIIDHLNAQKGQLEEQINSLQARLDKANRKISINEIHTESYVAERDEALKSATEQSDKIKQLQSELNTARQQLELMREEHTENGNTLELEINSLRKDNNSVRQQWKSLLEENRSLRDYNSDVSRQNADLEQDLKAAKAQLDLNKADIETLQQEYTVLLEEKAMIKEDNLSLEYHNDKFFNDNKVLKQQNSLLDRRVHDLQDEVARLKKLLDATNAETGTMSVEFKDIKYRLEVRNHELSEENAGLQQQIIDLQSDFSSKRMAIDQEKRRLATANERLKQKINQITRQFEQIVKDSKEEAAMYEEQAATLTQHLELIAGKESALANKLKKTADRRRTDAINEARQITQEIKDFMSTVDEKKQAKTTRIVEPKGKSVASETTARSTTSQTDMPLQDDYTQQIDLTQGSDYANVFTQEEIPELRETLRQARSETQQEDLINESLAFDDDEISDQDSQSLPPPFLSQNRSQAAGSHRAASGASKGRAESAKPQPIGILKDTQPSRLNSQKQQKATCTVTETDTEELYEREKVETTTGVGRSKSDDTIPRKVSFGRPDIQNERGKSRSERATKDQRSASEPELTGRSSVKSGASAKRYRSTVSEKDKYYRHCPDSPRFAADSDHEDNMTSALFIDDITLEEDKTTEKQKADKGELSKNAKRILDVFDGDHDCKNCTICTRINTYQCAKRGIDYKTKSIIRAPKPVPVTDRDSGQAEYEDQSTVRPSIKPGEALAKVLKTLQDEERHILLSIKDIEERYNNCDPSLHRNRWKTLGKKSTKLRQMRDLRRDQIYFLYDALEGQKASGQEMTEEFVEITVTNAMSTDTSFKGIQEYY